MSLMLCLTFFQASTKAKINILFNNIFSNTVTIKILILGGWLFHVTDIMKEAHGATLSPVLENYTNYTSSLK